MRTNSPTPPAIGHRRAAAHFWLAPVLAAISASAAAQASNPTPLQVQIWASSCMACHGPEGRAEGVGIQLAGKPMEELRGKLIAYKEGRLQATIMHQHAKGYSDDELSRIAAYFASLK